MKKAIIIITAVVLSFNVQASNNPPKYVKGEIYRIDGATYKYIGLDADGLPNFQGFKVKLGSYKVNKRLARSNKRKINKMFRKKAK